MKKKIKGIENYVRVPGFVQFEVPLYSERIPYLENALPMKHRTQREYAENDFMICFLWEEKNNKSKSWIKIGFHTILY